MSSLVTRAGLVFLPREQEAKPTGPLPTGLARTRTALEATLSAGDSWKRYNAKAAAAVAAGVRGPAALLKQALAQGPVLPAPRNALDLGCGVGADTLCLQSRGFHVWSIDASDHSLAFLRAVASRTSSLGLTHIETQCSFFENIDWPALSGGVSLINADHSLPFCAPEKFDDMWRGLTQALLPGGMFVGVLFGTNNWISSATKHTHEDLNRLFRDYAIQEFREEGGMMPTALCGEQRWHRYYVIAIKRNDVARNGSMDAAHLRSPHLFPWHRNPR